MVKDRLAIYAGLVGCVMVVLAAIAVPVTATDFGHREVSDSTVTPGQTITVTFTVETDGDGGKLTISEYFTPPAASVTVESIEVGGTPWMDYQAFEDPEGITVTSVDPLPAHTTVTMTYSVTVPQTASSSFEISGEVAGTGVGGGVVNTGTTTISVSSPTTPSLARFDTNTNGQIGLQEVLHAIAAYNTESEIGGSEVTLDVLLDLISAYNTAQPVS